MRLPPVLRGARAALVFLTRIPVGGFPYSDADWRWASGWFSWVGLLLGGVYALLLLATARAGGLVGGALVVAAALLLTGAFHEDGLADTADALGGGLTRERVLEILKDSRIGAFGAAALCSALLLRAALIARLGARAGLALVILESLSRSAPVWLMTLMPYATLDAAAKSRLVRRAGVGQALLGSLWPALALALALGAGWLSLPLLVAVIAGCALATALCAWRFAARVGGLTGDFLGAVQQLCLLVGLLLWALIDPACPSLE